MVSYNTRLRSNWQIVMDFKQNYQDMAPFLKERFKTFTWLKVENKTLFNENVLKVPVWSNKINNLQIFQSFAFQAKYFLQKNDP